MSRVLITVLLLFIHGALFACEPDPIPNKYRQYLLKQMDVRYQRPTGRIARQNAANTNAANPSLDRATGNCSLSADFNGDGELDFAGIYRYREDNGRRKRSNEWSLDLVIMYTVDDAIKHVIFPYAGRYTAGNEPIRSFIVVQERGEIDLMPGRLVLDWPAIVSYREGNPAVLYYWNGNRFTQRAFGVDD